MKHHRRHAFTLVETMVVISLGAVILAMAGMLTTSLLGLRSARRAEHDLNCSVLALQQQWRSDVRGAGEGVVGQNGTVVTITSSAENVVEYRQDASTLIRTVHSGGKLAGRDRFPLPPGARVDCQWPTARGDVATLVIEYGATLTPGSTIRTRPLQGIVGGDLLRQASPQKGGT